MRSARIKRKTNEVNISIDLTIDGVGESKIDTGIDFLDHMLTLFTKHGLFNIDLKARGDLGVDFHHTNEDTAIAMGEAFLKALGDKKKLVRFGYSIVCMDDALVRCVVDVGGRPYIKIKPDKLPRESSNIIIKHPSTNKVYSYLYFKQFLKAFADHLRINLHLDILEGEGLHHILEASFKSLGLTLKNALSLDPRKIDLPTTKGKID